jgi:hypothetical protein
MFNRSRSSGQAKRQGTFSFFRGKKATTNELPAATDVTATKLVERPAPSYAHADRQRGEVDREAEDRGKTDEEIRESEGRNPKDEEGPKTSFVPATKQVIGNAKDTQPHTSSNLTTNSIFNRFWKFETDYDLEEVVQSNVNFWVPNAIAMFTILDDSAHLARDNRFMIKHHPEYLDYAVACYYSFLFYIQLLRARSAAGQLDGFERSFFNRFKDRFKFEELPVSSILEPYFSTIVATIPADSKYDWIVPTWSTDIFRATVRTTFDPAKGGYLIQPMVPQMLMTLRKAISSFAIDNVANPQQNFDDQDQYIPTRFLAGGQNTNIFGTPIDIDVEAASNSIIYGCGTRYPFKANPNEIALAGPKWRRSTFREFKYSFNLPNNVPRGDQPTRAGNLQNTKPINSLEHFLCMEKGENVSWFTELINQAALHARFFHGVTTLSKIPTTSGTEPLIISTMYDIHDGQAVPDRPSHLNLNDNANTGADHLHWYPNIFNEFRAGYVTSREHTEREEVYQAFSFSTNAEFSIVTPDNTNQIRLGGTNDYFRTGPYWANTEWASEFRHGARERAKPMFDGWRTMFQEDAAVVKPTGY